MTRENYWVRQLCTLNMVIPGRTIKQWREDNKEDHNIKRKEFETNNKGHLADYRRQYAIENADRLRAYKDNRKYETKANKQQPWTCECGMTMMKRSKHSHIKTKRHEEFM